MSKTKGGISAVGVHEKSTVNFNFPKDNKVQPVGLEGCGMDDYVTVILKGKLTSWNKSTWDESKSFGLELKSCEVLGEAKETSLDAAIKKADKDRKKV
jgi:hypothetical protein